MRRTLVLPVRTRMRVCFAFLLNMVIDKGVYIWLKVFLSGGGLHSAILVLYISYILEFMQIVLQPTSLSSLERLVWVLSLG